MKGNERWGEVRGRATQICYRADSPEREPSSGLLRLLVHWHTAQNVQ